MQESNNWVSPEEIEVIRALEKGSLEEATNLVLNEEYVDHASIFYYRDEVLVELCPFPGGCLDSYVFSNDEVGGLSSENIAQLAWERHNKEQEEYEKKMEEEEED